MDDFWGNFLLEIGLFTLLGILYYYYQKKKILKHEANKGPMIMGYILQACLTERGDTPEVALDTIIEAIDDYLHNRSETPPFALLKKYSHSPSCTPELKAIIEEGLEELA